MAESKQTPERKAMLEALPEAKRQAEASRDCVLFYYLVGFMFHAIYACSLFLPLDSPFNRSAQLQPPSQYSR